MAKAGFSLETATMVAALKQMSADHPKAYYRAVEKSSLQWLTWMNTGSRNTGATPPIRWGVLRGSSSVFVNRKLVGVFKQPIKAGAPEQPSPAKTDSETPILSKDELTATFVYNTDYAARVHEGLPPAPGADMQPGPVTARAPGAGGKWLETHLQRDKEDWIDLIGKLFKEDAS